MHDKDQAIDRYGAFVAFAPDAPAGTGPLADLRLAVKDVIAVAGLPFTAGHPRFAARVAQEDAPPVQRLREAGARIVGVTRTDAGGFGVTTPAVSNPVAPGRTVGGSSGGSAAAVAAGLADVALGTDAGGSVRIPAACTGLIGFKPTFDADASYGVWHLWPLSHSLDHIGVIGRDLDQVARVVDVLLGPAPSLDRRSPPERLRIGIDRAPMIHCDFDVEAAFTRIVEALAAKHDIIPLKWPDRMQVLEAHGRILLGDARSLHSSHTPEEIDGLAPVARRALAVANDITDGMLRAARRSAVKIRAAVDALLQRVDLLLSPTICCRVPAQDARRVEIRGQSTPVVLALISNTALFNLSGHPALALPTSETLDGIPFSIQIVAPAGADQALLEIARTLAPPVRLSSGLRN